MKPVPLLVLAIVAFLTAAPSYVGAQMLDPAMDRPDEPFCYFSHPTDVIGVMDGRMASLVSPEGYLYTGFTELMFFTGNPPEPVGQRVKTLLDGYLPVNEYRFERGGVKYAFRMFAATLDGNPERPLMNFIRVSIGNANRDRRAAWLGVATRYQNEATTGSMTGDNRFRRPAKARRPGEYEQPGVEFDPGWIYGFASDAFLRDGKILFLYPTESAPARMMTLATGYNDPPDTTARRLRILPTTPVGLVQYHFTLDPGEERVIDLKMPYVPLDPTDPDAAALRSARFDEMLGRTVAFWKNIFNRGIDIDLPEAKVNNTFKASLVYDLIARNKADSMYVQTVNDFHYHAFWLRDASYIVRMYDLSGYHDIAGQCLDFFARWQQPDGNFLSQGGQFDGWGQTMWAYGQHYRITRDSAFAGRVFPAIRRAVDWLHAARLGDSLRLMPSTSPGDNEDITGHVTGHNFWALAGLKNAIALAEGIGRESDAEMFTKEYDDYRSALLRRLEKVTAATGGYMPPGLDGPGGQDWGNMLSVYPEIILDPFDPMVTATLDATRAKYREGIMTYGDGRWMHHYLTMKNTETEIVRGDQQLAIGELYALLLHTSATHAGFEFCILPWSTRDFGFNLTPHGWFAAKFRAVLRNMMVREQGNALHLLSCLSPAWVKEGTTIRVGRAPTNFGEVNFKATFSRGAADISFSNAFVKAPDSVVLHLPWFMKTTRLLADGSVRNATQPAVSLPPGVRKVHIEWTRREPAPSLSYDNAVAAYKTEYGKRYELFLRDAQPR